MIKIEDFKNAPVGTTATHKATGHRAMKTYEDEWSWVTLIGRYLDDKEMVLLGYTLEPLYPLPTREEIADVILAGSLFGHRTPIAVADAVLALLKGEEE